MTARLGYSPAERHPSFNLLAKNVDEGPKTQGFSATALSGLGYLGHGAAREIVLRNVAAGERASAKFADRNRRSVNIDELAARFDAIDAADKSDPRIFVADAVPFKDRTHSDVARYLPPPLVPFLDRMNPDLREQREKAIIRKLGWETLELVGLHPSEIDARAEKKAAAYAFKFPATDEAGKPINQKPEHRKGRTAKTWKRRMAKNARKARAYLTAAVRSFGGAKSQTRSNYVADYSVVCQRAANRQSREHMENCRIVKTSDPTKQIPMIDAHEAKKKKEMAKRRLLIDVMQARASAIGARAIWITITLPGEYHPNPTNAGNEVRKWNPMLGPDEAMAEMQRLYHQTMALLRERRLRPWGFWDAQAQQDGTPHRHILVFVHDREMTEEELLVQLDSRRSEKLREAISQESEQRILVEARGVVDAFRDRFPGKHGCDASVVGDTHEDYKPREGRDGTEETAASIAKYMARYATRLATGMGEDHESDDDGVGDDGSTASDVERHGVWASERGARLHNWIGMDSPRGPGRIWDCIWKAAANGETPNDPRMELAVEKLAEAQRRIDELLVLRELTPNPKEEIDGKQALIAELAYQACLAAGIWAERDLHPSEKLWLRDALVLKTGAALPLPPIPLRAKRENAFGEEVTETIGIAAPVVLAMGMDGKAQALDDARRNGSMVLTAEDGGWLTVEPSGKTSKQILLRDDEWVIVDKATAAEMAEQAVEDAKRRKAVEEEERERKLFLDRMERLENPRESERCNTELPKPTHGPETHAMSPEGCTARKPNPLLVSMKTISETARGTAAIGRESAGLSLIATDPRLGPAARPLRNWDEVLHILTHGLEDEPEPPGIRKTQQAKIVDAKALRRMQQRKGFDRL